MKASLFSIAGLSALAVAVPHGGQVHRHQHAKKEAQRGGRQWDVVTEVEVATATAPRAVVYVDTNGNPLSTSIVGGSSPTEAPSSSEESSSYVAPSSTAEEPSVAPAQTSSSSSSNAGSGSGLAITYSPYNSDGTCKSQSQVTQDFEGLAEYSMVRSYGTDCNQVSTMLSAASAHNIKMFLGIFDIFNVESQVADIVAAANGDWSNIHTVSVGNEGVNNGQYSVSDVVSAIGTARSALSAAGYTGSVVTVDTFVAMIANPELCQASDYAAANCHAFFDGAVTAENAGEFVLSQAQRVSEACGGKHTMITESGWPSRGSSNGVAVPGAGNQRAAISSLRASFSDNLILFTAYDDLWKSNNAGTFEAEQYWGIYGSAPSS